MDNQKVGALIATRRKALGMTQKALAEQIHVTNKAISKWETGAGFPDVGSLELLAVVLEVSLVELLHGELMQTDMVSTQTAQESVVQVLRAAERREQQASLESLAVLFAVPVAIGLLWMVQTPEIRGLLWQYLPWIFGSIGVVATLQSLWRCCRKKSLLRKLLSATAVAIALFSASAIIMAVLLFCIMRTM